MVRAAFLAAADETHIFNGVLKIVSTTESSMIGQVPSRFINAEVIVILIIPSETEQKP